MDGGIGFNIYLPGDPDYVAPAVNHGSDFEHQYSLDQSKHHWLTLKIASSHYGSAGAILRFFDEDVITGSVELDLQKSEDIKNMTIAVIGIATVDGLRNPLNFLALTETLYDSHQSGNSLHLTGPRSYPFSIKLPREVSVGKKGHSVFYNLPPTFSEKGINSIIFIDYRIIVRIKRGMFSPNSTLAANIAILPKTIAALPSPHRRMAYDAGLPLPGPEIDIDGWMEVAPVTVKGTEPSSKDLEVTCTLAIATPLMFALGSPIPLILTLSSSDEAALESLANPIHINIVLERFLGAGTGQLDAPSTKDDQAFRDFFGNAVFWPMDALKEGTRRLQGELAIPYNLRPSCSFATMKIKYAVSLLPFQVPGFVHSNHKEIPLVKQEVTIVTINAEGVTPLSYAPPPPYVLGADS